VIRKNRFFYVWNKKQQIISKKQKKSAHISKIKIPQYQENRTHTEGKFVREKQHFKDDYSKFAQKLAILFIECVRLTQKFFCDI